MSPVVENVPAPEDRPPIPLLGLRLDREGRWWHDGHRVEHPRVEALFRRGLCRDAVGRPLLAVGSQHCPVEVEDTLFRITAADVESVGDGSILHLRRDDGQIDDIRVVDGVLGWGDDGVLYVRVDRGREWARCSPAVHARLGAFVSLRAEDDRTLLWDDGGGGGHEVVRLAPIGGRPAEEAIIETDRGPNTPS